MDITRGDDMAFEKITDEDLVGIGVIGLPDTPGLSTEDMQEKFEETARSVVIPKFNQAMDELPEVRTGALASFPRPGTPGKIYVDTTAIPALMYMWDADLEEYVPAGGTGGGTGGGGYDTTVSVPASGWAGDAAPYSQEVTATGMTANMAVVLAQVTSSAVATDAEKEAFSLISGYAQDEDSVTFYAAKKPDTDLMVRIFSGGGGEGGGTDYSVIGDEFSDKRPYSIGERCIFKNTLWKFTANKPAGAWDSTKVEATTVDAELAELRGKVDELNSRTKWTLLKNVTGGEAISLPDKYDEISVVLTIKEVRVTITGNITKSQLEAAIAAQGESSIVWVIGGAYAKDNAYGGAYFDVTETTITLLVAAWNKIDYNPKINVYYR